MRFFFYGTLIDPDVRRVVLGPHAPRRVEPARLQGWRRAAVPGRTYPVIVIDAGAHVDGVLVHGLGTAARRRLERYEDADLYALLRIGVLAGGRRRFPALVFAAKSAGRAGGWGTRKVIETWDFAAWRRRDKQRLLMSLRRRTGV